MAFLIFTGILLLLLCLTPTFCLAIWPERWRLRDPSSAAVAVATLLRADPDGWVRNTHVWSHTVSGIHLWVAHQESGLRWWTGRAENWSGTKPPREDQRHVWRTLQPIMSFVTQDVARRALDALRDTPATVSANVVRLRS